MSLNAGTLYVSSYNNGDFDTSTKFSITLAVPVIKAKRIRILSASIANLMMPFGVNDYNFRYIQTVSGTPTTYDTAISQTRRWTDVNAFVTYMNTILSAGVTMTYDSNTNKLTLVASAGNTVAVPAWNYNTTGSVAQSAGYRLGFTNLTTTPAAASVTADGFPNVILRTNVIYVVSNISTDSNNDANIGNIIARIPVNASWGSLIQYENVTSQFGAPIFTERVKDIQITLLDEDYQLLVNPNNAYFNIAIGVEY
jgi:hypothetical protein